MKPEKMLATSVILPTGRAFTLQFPWPFTNISPVSLTPLCLNLHFTGEETGWEKPTDFPKMAAGI